MGRNIPQAGTVSDSMINDFIKNEIIPHFEYGTFIDPPASRRFPHC